MLWLRLCVTFDNVGYTTNHLLIWHTFVFHQLVVRSSLWLCAVPACAADTQVAQTSTDEVVYNGLRMCIYSQRSIACGVVREGLAGQPCSRSVHPATNIWSSTPPDCAHPALKNIVQMLVVACTVYTRHGEMSINRHSVYGRRVSF